MSSFPILSMRVTREHDLVAVRQRARQIATLVGFETQDQTRISTAASEIVRNALVYAGGGRVDFAVQGEEPPQTLTIIVSDKGPGIPDVNAVLGGRYHSPTGMGVGIIGSRRLVDQFRIDTKPGAGTTVTLGRFLPIGAQRLGATAIRRITDTLAREPARTLVEEMQQQNQELLRALDELRRRQDELARLNAELEDTNRGVVALYAELDERADSLRRADLMKSKFLSNMSHEFRTPLNSVRALAQILLDRTDGELTGEQQVQITLIQRAAEDLSELVNDLLDLAKVEAGKVVIRPAECDVRNLFGALRGMIKPLAMSDRVSLVFEEPQDVPLLYTDESKVSQILRNFLSNALKFTERGTIVVRATRVSADTVSLSVSDTGIGIAPEFHARIFQEFAQVDSPLQKKVRGTGLGLPLSMRLAQLLGGDITLESTPGVGSTFSLSLPVTYREPLDAGAASPSTPAAEIPRRRRVLVIDDDEASRYLVRRWLPGDTFEFVEQGTSTAAMATIRTVVPDVIVLDLMMPDLTGFDVIEQLQADERTRAIPVIVYTSMNETNARARLGRKVVDVVSKNQPAPAAASALRAAVTRAIQPVNT